LHAQQQGDFARSSELSSAIQLCAGITAIYLLTQTVIQQFSSYAESIWELRALHKSPEDFLQQVAGKSSALLVMFLPLVCLLLAGAIASHLIQNFRLTMFNQPIVDIRRLHVVHNAERMFSLWQLGRAAVAIPKFVLVAVVSGCVLWQQKIRIAHLASLPVDQISRPLTDFVFGVLIAAAVTQLVLSLIDYLIEWVHFFHRNRMSDQQLREENRLNSPNPQVEQQRRQFYRLRS
jgi:flagellar biosynthetic protein FlhB